MTAALAKINLEDNTPIRMWILSGIHATLVSKTPTSNYVTTTTPNNLATTQHTAHNTQHKPYLTQQ